MYIILVLERDINGKLIYNCVLYNHLFFKDDVEGVIEAARKEDSISGCEYEYKPVAVIAPMG